MEITIGSLLKEIRIKCGVTLRTFCLGRELDPFRYSMIERNVLKPNDTEVNEYIKLVEQKKEEKYVIRGEVSEELYEEIKNINLELSPLYRDVLHYCMTCGGRVVSTIYGLFEKNSKGLVNIMKGHEEPFVCKPCQKRIDMIGKKEKK